MANKSCFWHKDDQPVRPTIGCEYCGSILAIKQCAQCQRYFLDWAYTAFDDVLAGPFVSSSSDLMCMSCGPSYEREAERVEDEEAAYNYGDLC